MPTSASFVVEFIKGRPKLEAEVRKLLDQPYRAPEVMISMVADHVIETMGAFVTEDERKGLSRIVGNGNVNWNEVTRPFQKRPQRCFYCDIYKDVWEDSGGTIDCREGRDVHEWRHVDDPLKPIEVKASCTKPPPGWRCTRGFHETGPCAAVPVSETPKPLKPVITFRDSIELRDLAKGLLDSLPRCTNHPETPATKAKYRGNGRYCDECGEGIADYPRAGWVRKLTAFLAEKT